MKLHFLHFSLFFVFAFSIIPKAIASVQPFHASPDQVLVLYNADWQKDVDGSDPGQDSKEVAAYYVRMRTDSKSGKKPYLLGLKCVHGKAHLNDWVIREKSNDNKDGIEFIGAGRGPAADAWARDSRKVEIVVNPDPKEKIDWDSVTFGVKSTAGSTVTVTDAVVSGMPQNQKRQIVYPEVEPGNGRCYRFDAHAYAKGTITVLAKVKNIAGKTIRTLKLTYYDRDDFKPSLFGPDGVIDEKHFQEDVAIPVKAFLEDPKNALANSAALKDHILYIVICHGLPFSCEGVFGIERGVTSRPSDHGDLASLEQRLQTLYYGWGRQIIPPVISMYMSGGPDGKDGVRNYRITSAMRYPMVGRRWNPYMHPDTYSFLGSKKEPEFLPLPPFPEVRQKAPAALFAYGVSRVDGQGPREAKRLVDYSLYASKYLRPEMDDQVRQELKDSGKDRITDLDKRLLPAEKENKWGKEELQSLGFIPVADSNKEGIPFLKRNIMVGGSVGQKQLIDDKNGGDTYSGYYPGGMDRTVVSSNGWNMGRSTPIWQYMDQGVTVSACGGPAYGGGPHITNATFWDNRILMRYLFRGRDLGECFLRSTLYVNWSTSLVGDPLYHPDLRQTILDKTPPRVSQRSDIQVELFPAMGKYCGVVTVPIVSTTDDPEVAMLRVDYGKTGQNAFKTSSYPIYSTRPYVILRDLDPEAVYQYEPTLIDPYDNPTALKDQLGALSFTTGSGGQQGLRSKEARKRGDDWTIDLLRMTGVDTAGTLSIDFNAGINGQLPSIIADAFYLKVHPWSDGQMKIELQVGGPIRTWFTKSPLSEGERAVLILRWRRRPLTREVVLKAKNGKEFTLIADVRTPWEEMVPRGDIRINAANGVRVSSAELVDDALPASPDACRIEVPPIDESAWRQAQAGL